MLSTNTYRSSRPVLAVLLALAWGGTVRADSTDIVVVYPKPGQTITASDSTFIFGHLSDKLMKMSPGKGSMTSPKLTLKINGTSVPVYNSGGFLAFLSISPGDFIFKLKVTGTGRHKGLTNLAEFDLPVKVPAPLRELSEDTLRIVGDYRPPQGDVALSWGDRLDVQFLGTPNGMAWFSIPGVVDSVPMSETAPSDAPYWGESVFGNGQTSPPAVGGGIYSGFWYLPRGVTTSNAAICYHLCKSTKSGKSDPSKDQLKCLSTTSGYRVSLNSPEFPFTVRFTDSVQVVRVGPKSGYFSIFQPRGVEALAVGAEADWYRIRLSATQFGWVARSSVETLKPGILPPKSRIASIRTYDSARSVTFTFPLSGIHPYRVIEQSPRHLTLQLFGVTSNTDWIRYEYSDSLVDYCTWLQREDDLYEFTINLTHDLWGYDCYYADNTFCLKITKQPRNIHTLKGKTIVVDPGHSGDPGAIGPTGLTEAEANLGIALGLRKALESRGAKVVMTRSDMSNVALYDRPVIAKQAEADLFVSVHNNSLPDGVNPFTNNGTSVIYYHSWSADLARRILGQLLTATGLPDHGLYWGNLAVDRPTQYPAVLVECDFMILPDRESLLRTGAYRSKVAEAIAHGIDDYFRSYQDGR